MFRQFIDTLSDFLILLVLQYIKYTKLFANNINIYASSPPTFTTLYLNNPSKSWLNLHFSLLDVICKLITILIEIAIVVLLHRKTI